MTIDVLIADDSQYLRKSISDILIKHDSINIVDYARDGIEAIKLVKKYKPDVLVLDLVMPKKNGLDAFKEIMDEQPTPTVILSAISPKNLDSSIQALLMGAFDYIIKPGGLGAKNLPRFREELLAKVLLASQSQIKKIFQKDVIISRKTHSLRQQIVDQIFNFGQYINRLTPIQELGENSETDSFEIMKVKATLESEVKSDTPEKSITNAIKNENIRSSNLSKSNYSLKSKLTKDPLTEKSNKEIFISEPDLTPIKEISLTSNIFVIGASVGGPRTITTILKELPNSFSNPILIVQHLSSHFTEAFADNLNMECDLNIKVAKDGDIIQSRHVYIAPGDMHMEITVDNKIPKIKIFKGTPVNFCMPSIDVLFFSAAKFYRSKVMGIILTGMGSDGVEGLGAIKKVGGKTIAESEETCILYAMPKFAAEKGYADFVIPNYEIRDKIIQFAKN